MGIVVEVLCELENFHMSREELEVSHLLYSAPQKGLRLNSMFAE